MNYQHIIFCWDCGAEIKPIHVCMNADRFHEIIKEQMKRNWKLNPTDEDVNACMPEDFFISTGLICPSCKSSNIELKCYAMDDEHLQ